MMLDTCIELILCPMNYVGNIRYFVKQKIYMYMTKNKCDISKRSVGFSEVGRIECVYTIINNICRRFGQKRGRREGTS